MGTSRLARWWLGQIRHIAAFRKPRRIDQSLLLVVKAAVRVADSAIVDLGNVFNLLGRSCLTHKTTSHVDASTGTRERRPTSQNTKFRHAIREIDSHVDTFLVEPEHTAETRTQLRRRAGRRRLERLVQGHDTLRPQCQYMN